MVTVLTLLLVITGAILTSNSLVAAAPPLIQQFHRLVAGIAGLLVIGLGISVARLPNRPALPKLGILAIAVVLVDAVLGMFAPSAAFVHAALAQMLFGVVVAIAVLTSPAWCGNGEVIEDQMRPPMNTLAPIALGVVMLQVILGAAVRHKLLGPMSHISFAVFVALATLMLGMCVIHQAPQHKALRPGAITLMTITGVQVFLGFTAFIVKLMAPETSPVLMISTSTHVTFGALTLGATVLLTLLIRRYVSSAATQREARSTAAN
jgi:heme A synthase